MRLILEMLKLILCLMFLCLAYSPFLAGLVYLAAAAWIVLSHDPPIEKAYFQWLSRLTAANIDSARLVATCWLGFLGLACFGAICEGIKFLFLSAFPATPVTPTSAPPCANKKRTNGATLAGFWLGIASIFIYPLGIIPLMGIIFSCVGIATFDESIHKNRWMAGIGLALSLVYMMMNARLNGHFDRV